MTMEEVVTYTRRLSQSDSERWHDLVKAARNLIQSDGYEDLSMAAVAAAAGVKRSVLYRLFSSRGELIGEVLGQWTAETMARLAQRSPAGRTPAEKVADQFLALMDEAALHQDLVAAAIAVPSVDIGWERIADGAVRSVFGDEQGDDLAEEIQVLDLVVSGMIERVCRGVYETPRPELIHRVTAALFPEG